MLSEWIAKSLGFGAIDELVARAVSRPGPDSIFAKLRDEAGLEADIQESELAAIPASGPLIAVANQPTGFAEGVLVPSLLENIRPDILILGPTLFQRWPPLVERMIFAEPRAKEIDSSLNAAAVVRAARYVRKGSCIVMFPSAGAARSTPLNSKRRERPWGTGLAQLVRLSGAPIVPIHVSLTPTRLFRAASWLHPRLAIPLFSREAIKLFRVPIGIDVGTIVSARDFLSTGSPYASTDRLRLQLLELGE